MTPAAFTTALADLGIVPTGFARLSGINPSTVRRWGLGALPVPPWTEVMLDLLALPGGMEIARGYGEARRHK